MAKDSLSEITQDQAWLVLIKNKLNEEMQAAAEPLLQEALKRIEHEMRTKLASNLIAMIDASVRMDRRENELVVTIRRS